VGTGTIASVFSGAWMPSMLLANVPGAAGLWRASTMPTYDGQPTNAEIGGSALTVLQLTRKPDAAYRFVDFVTHDAQGVQARVDGGAFPADYTTLNSEEFLDKTTITNDRGIEIPYFGGQKFNRVLSEAAEDVSVGYQYLPFEVYSRNDFTSTVGKAYRWASSFQAYQDRQVAVDMGLKDEEGKPLEPLEYPGAKVSLADGLSQWQKDLKEYGFNQGFTIK
jgi:multiple sugar transport system substrate-binding protein